mmetsp:Transcript_88985/g.157562  ORF Transcript_88985/g.157562 Transcript_88985/m.157562 type:complete len:1421 (+) Transcript_88985:90-4352(+)|eukprot:CAMPEP_0197638244 /NCGR_PEP_ID=MMETSP1338-20131121/13224_1 /TAXON_ID=43686 ORGANISM="Pelagodinium beii, Strain RCC1491" /NCGR_SAMPLE_ID=MMETSP1338 /ASSEMBLY_ACC=CAM_ASM_000754 /LENGTH=1420 /DNA_ID=CAMNT_0043210789 /DNA_START=1 /DNA_END=4263 /DNA_ORIENTATION=+
MKDARGPTKERPELEGGNLPSNASYVSLASLGLESEQSQEGLQNEEQSQNEVAVTAAAAHPAPCGSHTARLGARPHPRPPVHPEKVALRLGLSPSRLSPAAMEFEIKQDGHWSSSRSTRATSSSSSRRTGTGTSDRRRPPRHRLMKPLTLQEHLQQGRPSPRVEAPEEELEEFGTIDDWPGFAATFPAVLPVIEQSMPEPAGSEAETAQRKVRPVPKTAPQLTVSRAEALQRLATPRHGGASDRTKRRALHKEFENYANQAAGSLLPGIAAPDGIQSGGFNDVWHTAGEDGYRSAVFHAAVRCRELLRNAGIEECVDEYGNFSFKGYGTGGIPELVRLQQACFLLEEISVVSSPLRDTLRFLSSELLSCIYDGYKSGSDPALLTPFFVLRHQDQREAETCRQRATELEREKDGLAQRVKTLQDEVAALKNQLVKERKSRQEDDDSYQTVVQQRNELRMKVDRLMKSDSERYDDLREMTQELSKAQAESYLSRKEQDAARKELAVVKTHLKDSNQRLSTLMRRVVDLQDALLVAGEGGGQNIQRAATAAALAAGAVAGSSLQMLDLPPELELELAILSQRGGRGRNAATRRSDGENGDGVFGKAEKDHSSTVDGQRLLKAALPDGGFQVVLKGRVDDQTGLKPASSPAIAAAAAGAAAGRKPGHAPPVLLVSGEAFAALTISQGLPIPLDPLQFGANDDESLVKEVVQECETLTHEYGLLLELYRGLRQDMKNTLRLVPRENIDELRGVFQHVLIFDPEEATLVPSPVSESVHVVGLGEGAEVPPYLRYVGLMPLKQLPSDELFQLLNNLWREKTEITLQEEQSGRPKIQMDSFMSEVFLPAQAANRPSQMELVYNFLIELRNQTSLKDIMPNTETSMTTAAGQRRKERLTSRQQTMNDKDETGADLLNQLSSHCSSCGNIYADDSTFCRRCGEPRQEEDGKDTAGKRKKKEGKQLVPIDTFSASAEVLYRGLQRELHEDAFHDASTMLLNLCACLVGLGKRFAPIHQFKDEAEGQSLRMNMAVFSAVLKLFFPAKSREQLTALKSILLSDCKPATDSTKEAGSVQQEERAADVSNGVPSHDETLPLVVDVGKVLCLPPVLPDGTLGASNHELLDNLLRRPTPLVNELRRQHLVEGFMFLDKLQRAFRANKGRSGHGDGPAPDGKENMVNAREILDALATTDHWLTEDQRNLYLLRGFGRRLPDMPSSTAENQGDKVAEAVAAAARVTKVRRILQDYCVDLVDSGSTVAIDDFVKRILSSGVAKCGRHWQPEFTPQEVAQESGIAMWQAASSNNPNRGKNSLETFVKAHIAFGGTNEESAMASGLGSGREIEKTHSPGFSRSLTRQLTASNSPREATRPSSLLMAGAAKRMIRLGTQLMHEKEKSDPWDRYGFLAEVARDLQELSIGYPGLYLCYWVNNNL